MASSRFLLGISLLITANAFAPCVWTKYERTALVRRMGIFDEIKGAFASQDDQAIDSARETPIDRWLGINVKVSKDAKSQRATFIDSMDDANYRMAALSKPMGIVFEENDASVGGVFVASMTSGGSASKNGVIQLGDQLVAVNGQSTLGLNFDDALGKIIDSTEELTSIIVFRGGVGNLYGNLGPAADWLAEFLPRMASKAK